MTYDEYLTTADRHNVACECLLTCLDDAHTSKEDGEKLLAEVYYLTGYIAEGSINYGLYHLVIKKGLFQASQDVTKLNIGPGKLFLTYCYHIEKHKFKDNLDILINLGEDEFGKSTPAISQLTKLTETIKKNRLFSRWTTNYRYVAPPYSDSQEIRDFLNDCQKLKNAIRSLTKQGT